MTFTFQTAVAPGFTKTHTVEKYLKNGLALFSGTMLVHDEKGAFSETKHMWLSKKKVPVDMELGE